MISKTITFTDFNDVERTETHYFHLSKAEVMEMEMSTAGGLVEMINGIIEAKDAPAIIKIFKDLILKSYGQKSPDGRQFIKNEKLRTEFEQTEAFSQLFMELATDADAASKFVNGILPAMDNETGKKQAGSNKIEHLPVN